MNVHLGSGICDDDEEEEEAADMKGTVSVKTIFNFFLMNICFNAS